MQAVIPNTRYGLAKRLLAVAEGPDRKKIVRSLLDMVERLRNREEVSFSYIKVSTGEERKAVAINPAEIEHGYSFDVKLSGASMPYWDKAKGTWRNFNINNLKVS